MSQSKNYPERPLLRMLNTRGTTTLRQKLLSLGSNTQDRHKAALHLRCLLWAYLLEYGDPKILLRLIDEAQAIVTGPGVLALIDGEDPLEVAQRLVLIVNRYVLQYSLTRN